MYESEGGVVDRRDAVRHNKLVFWHENVQPFLVANEFKLKKKKQRKQTNKTDKHSASKTDIPLLLIF
jgi:hypothetical protein